MKPLAARLSLILLLLPPACVSAFTCCTGQSSCGGYQNDPVVCSALGDLYAATNGPSWLNNTGWAAAAAGSPTDFCGRYNHPLNPGPFFYYTLNPACSSAGVLTYLCVLLLTCCSDRFRAVD